MNVWWASITQALAIWVKPKSLSARWLFDGQISLSRRSLSACLRQFLRVVPRFSAEFKHEVINRVHLGMQKTAYSPEKAGRRSVSLSQTGAGWVQRAGAGR